MNCYLAFFLALLRIRLSFLFRIGFVPARLTARAKDFFGAALVRGFRFPMIGSTSSSAMAYAGTLESACQSERQLLSADSGDSYG
jgi:hypothetical protein